MLDTKDTAVVCIDLQEKLVNMLVNSDFIASRATKLMNASHILNIDTIITEQYPKGLGETISSISSIKKFDIVEKNTFSAYRTPEFKEKIDSLKKRKILIFGIETHICVFQTVIDLLNSNYEVYVVADCCASRSEFNNNCALELMKQQGARVITLEIALFDFLKSSKHPNFKEIQALIK